MILEIKARFSCDGCGRKFFVCVDPASSPPNGGHNFEAAEDALRGGLCYHEQSTPPYDASFAAIIGGRHLCGPCAKAADAMKSKAVKRT